MTNKYAGTCRKCGNRVPARTGILKRIGHKWTVTCQQCEFDANDHSSYEDRCCGDMAYEDQCARACGLNY